MRGRDGDDPAGARASVLTSRDFRPLVAALWLGPRRDVGRQVIVPHSVPFALLGAGLAGRPMAIGETVVLPAHELGPRA